MSPNRGRKRQRDEEEPQPSTSKDASPSRKKNFSEEQYRMLEALFQTNRSPPQEQREELAKRAEMTVQQVNTWFVNRRRRPPKIPKEENANEEEDGEVYEEEYEEENEKENEGENEEENEGENEGEDGEEDGNEENMENPLVALNPIEHGPNVVPVDDVNIVENLSLFPIEIQFS